MIKPYKMTIPEIIEEINWENGSNYKMDVLRRYKNEETSELLQKVLKMTYDKVSYTFGISMKNIPVILNDLTKMELSTAVDMLEKLADRTYTGDAAKYYLTNILNSLNEVDSQVIKGIINRDLRINMGRSNINKVFKNLIVKPPYMRCSIYTEKTRSKISFPSFVQVKADGMFQTAHVDQGKVTFMARSGEERSFPHLYEYFIGRSDGVYIGELLVKGETDRAKANGFINSDEEDKTSVYFQLWDYITLDEYSRPKDKKNKVPYSLRFDELNMKVKETSQIKIIETYIVQNIQEALKFTSKWMNQGLEGAILKDMDNMFIDHTSPTQLKLKLEIDAEVRVTGFIEGKKGTKREETFGSMTFENDEGTIKGSTSGFNDKQLNDFNQKREELIGKVITVQFNDVTKGRDNDYYALSHPRFIEFRDDKNTTDTLERILESKEMAMTLGGK